MNSFKHTVFLVNCVPDVRTIVCSVTFPVFLQVYKDNIVVFWVLVWLTPLVPGVFWWFFVFGRSWKSELMVVRHRYHFRLVLQLLVFPKHRDGIIAAFTNRALVRITHPLLSPKGTLLFNIDFVCGKVCRFSDLAKNWSDYFIQVLQMLHWLANLINLSSYPLSLIIRKEWEMIVDWKCT